MRAQRFFSDLPTGLFTLGHLLEDEETTVPANWFATLALLAEPKRESDKVKRARLVSGYLYGLQWWLRDVYYWWLRKEG